MKRIWIIFNSHCVLANNCHHCNECHHIFCVYFQLTVISNKKSKSEHCRSVFYKPIGWTPFYKFKLFIEIKTKWASYPHPVKIKGHAWCSRGLTAQLNLSIASLLSCCTTYLCRCIWALLLLLQPGVNALRLQLNQNLCANTAKGIWKDRQLCELFGPGLESCATAAGCRLGHEQHQRGALTLHKGNTESSTPTTGTWGWLSHQEWQCMWHYLLVKEAHRNTPWHLRPSHLVFARRFELCFPCFVSDIPLHS